MGAEELLLFSKALRCLTAQ